MSKEKVSLHSIFQPSIMQIKQNGRGFSQCFLASLQHLPQAQGTQAIRSNLLSRCIRLPRGLFSLLNSSMKKPLSAILELKWLQGTQVRMYVL